MLVNADFCLIPMVNDASIAKHIATVQHILKDAGLVHELHGYGTNIEGEWMDVMAAIEACHKALHDSGVARISTTIRVGTRTDKIQTNKNKIKAVEAVLNNLERT